MPCGLTPEPGSLISAARPPGTSSSSVSTLAFLDVPLLGVNITDKQGHTRFGQEKNHWPNKASNTTIKKLPNHHRPTNYGLILTEQVAGALWPHPAQLLPQLLHLRLGHHQVVLGEQLVFRNRFEFTYLELVLQLTLVLCCSASKFAKLDRKLFTSCSSWSLVVKFVVDSWAEILKILEVEIFEIGTCLPAFDGAVGSPLEASIGAHQHCLNKIKLRCIPFYDKSKTIVYLECMWKQMLKNLLGSHEPEHKNLFTRHPLWFKQL